MLSQLCFDLQFDDQEQRKGEFETTGWKVQKFKKVRKHSESKQNETTFILKVDSKKFFHFILIIYCLNNSLQLKK